MKNIAHVGAQILANLRGFGWHEHTQRWVRLSVLGAHLPEPCLVLEVTDGDAFPPALLTDVPGNELLEGGGRTLVCWWTEWQSTWNPLLSTKLGDVLRLHRTSTKATILLDFDGNLVCSWHELSLPADWQRHLPSRLRFRA